MARCKVLVFFLFFSFFLTLLSTLRKDGNRLVRRTGGAKRVAWCHLIVFHFSDMHLRHASLSFGGYNRYSARAWLACASLLLFLGATAASPVRIANRQDPVVSGKSFDRVVVIVLANGNYDDVTKDVYFSSLPTRHNGLLLTNYEAVAHPSQPNYVGMISGSSSGVMMDLKTNIKGRESIVDALEDKGISWKAYQEDYPDDGKCHTDMAIANYRRIHNPFMSFNSISSDAKRCANIVAASQLDTDIKNNAVPQFVFYTPNVKNNGADTGLAVASNWTKTFLESRINNKAFSKNTLFVLTWDQHAGSMSLKNQVPAYLFGPAVQRTAKTDGNPYSHYSIVETIRANWGLPAIDGDKNDKISPFVTKDGASNGASEKIKNVVILFFENRSYDRIMGWFKYNPELDGLTTEHCNYFDPKDKTSTKICSDNEGPVTDSTDPKHEWYHTTHQITGDMWGEANTWDNMDMSGFVALERIYYPEYKDNITVLKEVMQGFKESTIPVTYDLASNFTVLDRWYASFPGNTMPNKLYLFSGTSHGEVTTDKPRILMGYPQRTIFNNLEDAGIDWANYYQMLPTLLVFNKHRYTSEKNFKRWGFFLEDAAAGKLPPVSVIDPSYFSIGNCIPKTDAHPPGGSMADSEKLLKQVYEALRASPQWNNTLLIVAYDEHGGYYDHVKPPVDGIPNPDGINTTVNETTVTFDKMGLRVPAMLISPWIAKNGVVHEPKNGPYKTSRYEHTSVLSTIKKIFNLPNYLTARDEWAASFDDLLLDEPRTDCPMTLSEPPPSAYDKPKGPVV
ncbi:phosphoesterase family-domain-containing protein [Gongronella butleri]|nr:phosphoesterase family-domain-containing protein [Gongronella butleri]